MTLKRGLIYAVILLGLGATLWFLRRHDAKVDQGISSTVLGPKDQERIIFDPKHHTVTAVSGKGVTKQYLPPRTTNITITKDGGIVFHSRAYGTELSPFIGFGYSDQARLMLGVGLLYYHNWEGNLALAPTVSGKFSLRLALTVSYILYSNTSLFAGVDTTKSPIGGISFKF